MLSPFGIPSVGEVSPRLNPPIPRPASATCWCVAAIALPPSSLPPKRPELFESAGLCAPDEELPPLRRVPPPPPLLEEARWTRPTPGACWPEIRSPSSPYTLLLITPLLTELEPLLPCCIWTLKDLRNFSGPSRRETLPDTSRSAWPRQGQLSSRRKP